MTRLDRSGMKLSMSDSVVHYRRFGEQRLTTSEVDCWSEKRDGWIRKKTLTEHGNP